MTRVTRDYPRLLDSSGSHQSLLSMPVAWGGGATREPSSCDGSALGDFDLPFDSTLPSPHGDRSSVGSISRDRTPLSTPQRPPPAGAPQAAAPQNPSRRGPSEGDKSKGGKSTKAERDKQKQ